MNTYKIPKDDRSIIEYHEYVCSLPWVWSGVHEVKIDMQFETVTVDATLDGFELVPTPTESGTPAPTSCLAYDFYRRLTTQERMTIRAFAAADPIAYDFMHTLELTIANKGMVNFTDPDLVAGMGYFQMMPQGNPIFTPARVAELLGS